MVLAAINAFVYHRYTERRIAEWDDAVDATDRSPVRGVGVDLRLGHRHHGRADDVLYDVLTTVRVRLEGSRLGGTRPTYPAGA